VGGDEAGEDIKHLHPRMGDVGCACAPCYKVALDGEAATRYPDDANKSSAQQEQAGGLGDLSDGHGDGDGCSDAIGIEEGSVVHSRSSGMNIDLEAGIALGVVEGETLRIEERRAGRKQQVVVTFETIRWNETSDASAGDAINGKRAIAVRGRGKRA